MPDLHLRRDRGLHTQRGTPQARHHTEERRRRRPHTQLLRGLSAAFVARHQPRKPRAGKNQVRSSRSELRSRKSPACSRRTCCNGRRPARSDLRRQLLRQHRCCRQRRELRPLLSKTVIEVHRRHEDFVNRRVRCRKGKQVIHRNMARRRNTVHTRKSSVQAGIHSGCRLLEPRSTQ